MEKPALKTLLECLLFVAEGPVSLSKLASVLEADESAVEEALQELADEYRSRGIRIQRQGKRYQMTTAPEFAPVVERFLRVEPARRLSRAALETLAIVAYRQPVTRAQIEAIRGVNSDGVIRTLLSRGLIEEVGHLEQPGRPVLYGTTFEFLRYFGLSSLEELPPLEEDAGAAGPPENTEPPAGDRLEGRTGADAGDSNAEGG